MLSLRKIVIAASGQDVRRCQNCSFCSDLAIQDMDLSLESLIIMVQMNDDEVLTSRTLWSNRVMKEAKKACNGGINLPAVMMALRTEAIKRGIQGL